MEVKLTAPKCEHTANAQIKMPSVTGSASNACPLVWCRSCGAIWLPRQPSFDRAFERHEREKAVAPVDGVGGVDGYWITPGEGLVVRG